MPREVREGKGRIVEEIQGLESSTFRMDWKLLACILRYASPMN